MAALPATPAKRPRSIVRTLVVLLAGALVLCCIVTVIVSQTPSFKTNMTATAVVREQQTTRSGSETALALATVKPTNTTVGAASVPTAPKPTNTPAPVYVYVSAEGDSVYLRSKPDMEAKMGLYPDGTKLVLLEKAPDGWMNVRTPDNSEGYMPAQYVSEKAPPSPTVTPKPTDTRTPIPVAVKQEAAAFQSDVTKAFTTAEAAGENVAAWAKAIGEGRSYDYLSLYQSAKVAAEQWEAVKFYVNSLKVSEPLRAAKNDMFSSAARREDAYRSVLKWIDSGKMADMANYQDNM